MFKGDKIILRTRVPTLRRVSVRAAVCSAGVAAAVVASLHFCYDGPVPIAYTCIQYYVIANVVFGFFTCQYFPNTITVQRPLSRLGSGLLSRAMDRHCRLGLQKPMSPFKTKCFPFKRIKIAFRKWYRIRHVRGRKHARPPRRKQSGHKKRRTRRNDPRRILCLLSGASPPLIAAALRSSVIN